VEQLIHINKIALNAIKAISLIWTTKPLNQITFARLAKPAAYLARI
jgi:hypothetical protein